LSALDRMVDTLELLANPAADLAAKQLRDLAGGDDSAWEAIAIEVAAQAVEAHGADGLHLALRQVRLLAEGKTDFIDVADARTSHALLVALEKAEDVRRSQVRDFFCKLGEALGHAGAAMLARGVRGTIL